MKKETKVKKKIIKKEQGTKKITFTFELDFLADILTACKEDHISIQDKGYEHFRNYIAEKKLRKKTKVIKRG